MTNGFIQTPTIIGGDVHDWVMIDDRILKRDYQSTLYVLKHQEFNGPSMPCNPDQWIEDIFEETDKLSGVDWVGKWFSARSNDIPEAKQLNDGSITHQIYMQILKEVFWILCKKGKPADREQFVERDSKDIAKHIGTEAGSALSTAGLSAYLATTFGNIPLGVITTLVTLILLKASHRSFCILAGNYFDSLNK